MTTCAGNGYRDAARSANLIGVKTLTSTDSALLPGLVLTGAVVAVAMAVSSQVPALSALTVAVALGVVVGNLPRLPADVRPGLAWVSRTPLRAGLVLLGLQLSLGQLLGMGWGVVLAVLITVVLTFAGTVWFGRLLGVPRGLSILVATGFSVCGASAVAAVEGVVDREEEDVATSVAMVTVFGTVAMVALPVAFAQTGVGGELAGRIAGAGVQEVAQVVAAASPLGASAVAVAVVVKLSRVVLLAPLVTVVSAVQRRAVTTRRPPLVPLFVVGFLAAVALRSSGELPDFLLDLAKPVTTVLLTAALFALGTTVRLEALMRTSPRAFALGTCSTLLVTALATTTMTLLS
ncbi:putative sulfate exporter family transporter [Saccharopolyspora rhizosphaerae]|uniref:Putative sulfate exporter family transporter n=1 Tax=Saccharopolyspora rhizosphaerae TaxID=2492662 RepID=A0A3R8QZ22_9PSEU|nr:putative sulfate exporter family transporter [Saccharopolyspora rhizosphaerae]RRO14210.1 putative sulfate exporter family transporter [Saccharopolyspora rhizosphaerae]